MQKRKILEINEGRGMKSVRTGDEISNLQRAVTEVKGKPDKQLSEQPKEERSVMEMDILKKSVQHGWLLSSNSALDN